MLQIAILLIFPGLMIFAAISDLFTMRISNRIPLTLLLVFLPLAILAGLSGPTIAIHFACGVGVLALSFALFAFGWIGGGDAKLAVGTAVWLGLDHLADYGIYTALIGGVLTLCILAVRHVPLPAFAIRIDWMARLHDRTSGIPYGIALAAAGLMLYPETNLWHAMAVA